MNIWWIIGIGAVVAGLVFLFVRSKKKPEPSDSGFFGLPIPTSLKTYHRTDGGAVMFPEDYTGFEGDGIAVRVMEVITRALTDERATALHYKPDWTLPEPQHVHVIAIPAMFFTEAEHLPGLILRPTGGGEFYTAGTVINTGWRYTPNVNSDGSNPIIVIAYQENWDRLDYLYNTVYNEAEHVRERWAGFDEFMQFSGPADVHPHRPPIS